MKPFKIPAWILRRRAKGGEIPPATVTTQNDLWWVKVILNVGRPVVAVIVLIMCAPGEHYLAKLAGWSHWLAWGMPATLTAYAGIAAVVATKRPKKSPGKATAVAGAIISVLLAMGAQPIAHLYEQKLITGHLFLLTIVISCIPALVFGHLLHMAAAPVVTQREQFKHAIRNAYDLPARLIDTDNPDGDLLRAVRDHHVENPDLDPDLVPQYSPDAMTYRAGDEDTPGMDAGLDYLRGGRSRWDPDTLRREAMDAINRPRPMPVPDPAENRVPDRVSDAELTEILSRVPARDGQFTGDDVPAPWRGHEVDFVIHDETQAVPPVLSLVKDTEDTDTEDMPTGDTEAEGDNYPGPPRGQTPLSRPVTRPRTPRTGTSVTGRVRDILADRPDVTDEDIRDTFAGEDIRPNTINKAIKRVRDRT